MDRNSTIIAMPTTPCQTYLEERLQSARGLGWAVTVDGVERSEPRQPRSGGLMRFVPHRILRFCLGLAG